MAGGAPGRPALCATTPRFLAQFSLRSLRDLPDPGLPLLSGTSRAGEETAPVVDGDAFGGFDGSDAA